MEEIKDLKLEERSYVEVKVPEFRELSPDASRLVQAVRDHNVTEVKKLLEHGPDPAGIVLPEKERLLHLAVKVYDPEDEATGEILRLLLSAGCNPNAIDSDHLTPLHVLCKREGKFADGIKILLDAGADVNRTASLAVQETPLMFHQYCDDPNMETIKLLVESSFDMSHINVYQQNALHYLVTSNLYHNYEFEKRVKVVRYLMERGVRADLLDEGSRTPLVDEMNSVSYLSSSLGFMSTPMAPEVLRRVSDVALELVAGGALSDFKAHLESLKGLFEKMIVFTDSTPFLVPFFLSIRQVIPPSEFRIVTEWLKPGDGEGEDSVFFARYKVEKVTKMMKECTRRHRENNIISVKEEDDDDDCDETIDAVPYFPDESSDSDEESSEDVENFFAWTSPPSLLSLSKIAIRNCLKGRVFQLVSLLNTLPKRYQAYLKSLR